MSTSELLRRLCTAAVIVSVGAVSSAHGGAGGNDNVFLFTSFQGNGERGLEFLHSDDGLNWERVPGHFLKPQVGSGKLLRDPSMVRAPDGRFHLVWTTAWRGDQGFGHSSSEDLVHWSEQRFIPVMASDPTTVNVWAPELFYDDRNAQYVIVWASTIPGRFSDKGEPHDNNQRMYFTTTSDFNTFAPAKLFFDPGFNVIDCSIVRNGENYVLALKDNSRTKMNLRVAFGESPLGPWHDLSPPFTQKFTEGPSVLKLGADYFVYFDAYRSGAFGAAKTRDFRSFEDATARVSFPPGHKHGTALVVPRSVLTGLLAARPQ